MDSKDLDTKTIQVADIRKISITTSEDIQTITMEDQEVIRMITMADQEDTPTIMMTAGLLTAASQIPRT